MYGVCVSMAYTQMLNREIAVCGKKNSLINFFFFLYGRRTAEHGVTFIPQILFLRELFS